jgi:septum formation protein
MLDAAGIAYQAVAPGVDEALLKREGEQAPGIATALAKAKAVAVSRMRPADWVIGSDSVVTVAGRVFDKPHDREEAAEHLRVFSGQALTLTSAVALARDGVVDWRVSDSARLEVRPLSERFIADYLDAEWPAVGYCVGVFRMEGRGVQLFEQIEGSHFTILGMPLLPLLGALRDRGVLQS